MILSQRLWCENGFCERLCLNVQVMLSVINRGEEEEEEKEVQEEKKQEAFGGQRSGIRFRWYGKHVLK